MRVPRQWSGADLKMALAVLGYEETRQTGSHIRLTTRLTRNIRPYSLATKSGLGEHARGLLEMSRVISSS